MQSKSERKRKPLHISCRQVASLLWSALPNLVRIIIIIIIAIIMTNIIIIITITTTIFIFITMQIHIRALVV